MAKKQDTPSSHKPPSTEAGGSPLDIVPTQIIYADKVIAGGFGPQVSRIQLGMERGQGKVVPTECIVLPTAAMVALLVNALPALKNDSLNQQMRSGLEQLRTELAAIEIKKDSV